MLHLDLASDIKHEILWVREYYEDLMTSSIGVYGVCLVSYYASQQNLRGYCIGLY